MSVAEKLGASHQMSLTQAVAYWKGRAEMAERRNLLNPEGSEYVAELEARVAQLEGAGHELAARASDYLYEHEESPEETPLDRAIMAWQQLIYARPDTGGVDAALEDKRPRWGSYAGAKWDSAHPEEEA
jgi:hypothetical protein